MNALNLLLKESKDRTSKEIERLLAKGDVESAKKAAYIINKMENRANISPWREINNHSKGKISDNEFIDRIKKMYYGDDKHAPLSNFRYKTFLIRQNNPNGKNRIIHEDSLPTFKPKSLLEGGKLDALENKTGTRAWFPSVLSDKDKKIYDKMRLGKDFGIKKYDGGFSYSTSDEAIERAKKLLEKSTVDKNVLKIPKVKPKTEQPKTEQPKTEPKALNKVTGNEEQPPKTEQPKDTNNKGNTNDNNADVNNNGNNGNTPKSEPEVKTNPVKESFLKKHWGKIGLGVGALGALGYGAYRYKHRDDNNN